MDHTEQHYTELTEVFKLFGEPASGYESGFMINGERYALLRSDDNALYGKSKSESKKPITIQKTATLLTIAIGVQGAQAGSLNMAVGKIADFLQENNY